MGPGPLAVHRAAHLIVGHALGLHLEASTSCALRPCLADMLDDPRVRIARRATCILAGAEGELLAFGRIRTKQARTDRGRIEAVAPPDATHALSERARSILRSRWRAVEVIARACAEDRFVDVRQAARMSGAIATVLPRASSAGTFAMVRARRAMSIDLAPHLLDASAAAQLIDERGEADLGSLVAHLLGDGRDLAAATRSSAAE